MSTPRKVAPNKKGKQINAVRLDVFVRHYVVHGNGAKAARAAGVPESRAKEHAYRWLQDPDVQVRVEQRRAEVMAKLDGDLERDITELARVAYSRVDDIATVADGQIIVHSFDDVPDRIIPAIAEIKQVEGGVQIKMHPKLPALLALARHHGLKDTQRHEHTGPDGAPLPVAPPATIHYHLPAAPRLKRRPEGSGDGG